MTQNNEVFKEKTEKVINQNNNENNNQEKEKISKKKKTRCSFCNKKTGLVSFTCDCKGVFCAAHLNAHSHNCFLLSQKKDIKQKQVKENNPIINFKKVESI